MQTPIRCTMMRAGTSRGAFFRAVDLPADPALRDAVLIAAMGAGSPLQADGLGGNHPQTSKVAIVSPATDPDADVDYLFAQVAPDRAAVDTAPNCGNMLAGVGPFAIAAGLVAARRGETTIRVRNVNAGALVELRVATPDGHPDPTAPIRMRLRDIVGGRTGRLFPTGARREELDGVPATLIDCANPLVLLDARALGADPDAAPEALETDRALMDRIEGLRRLAGARMGLGDVSDSVVPKPVLIGPAADAALSVRYFTPRAAHRALAVTGAIGLAAAVRLPGTLAAAFAGAHPDRNVRLRHPSGVFEVALELDGPAIAWADVSRTARALFEGRVLIPGTVWRGS